MIPDVKLFVWLLGAVNSFQVVQSETDENEMDQVEADARMKRSVKFQMAKYGLNDMRPIRGDVTDFITSPAAVEMPQTTPAMYTGDAAGSCSALPAEATNNKLVKLAFQNLELKIQNSFNEALMATSEQKVSLSSVMNDTETIWKGLKMLQNTSNGYLTDFGDIRSRLLTVEENVRKIRKYQREEKDKGGSGKDDMLVQQTATLWAEFQPLRNKVNQHLSLQFDLEKQRKSLQNMSEIFLNQLSQLDNLTKAVDILDGKIKVKDIPSTDSRNNRLYNTQYQNCDEVAKDGNRMNGVYEIWPVGSSNSHSVYCNLESGKGWTIIQRRKDGITTFKRGWAEYKWGFGSLYGDFWLGNELIHFLTNQKQIQLRVRTIDVNGNKNTYIYPKFQVGSSQADYLLMVQRIQGVHHQDPLAYHNGMKFSTFDRDNDPDAHNHCAARYRSGWWFNKCLTSNLNGRYMYNTYDGILWQTSEDTSATAPLFLSVVMEISEAGNFDDPLVHPPMV